MPGMGKTHAIAIALGAALLAAAPGPARAQVQVSIGIAFPEPPPLVVVSPGVRVVPELDEEVFFVGGFYWVMRDGLWYRTHDYRGGWAPVRRAGVPASLVRIPPGRYRHYYRDDDGRWRAHRAEEYREWRDHHPVDERRAWWSDHRHDRQVRWEQEHAWRHPDRAAPPRPRRDRDPGSPHDHHR